MLIFHHIAKTAGTSLLNILKQNYQSHELLELYGPHRASVDWYQTFYNSLTCTQKASIKCIAAHTAHYVIPVLEQLEQPFQVFCLLRDPVDRAISLYYFTNALRAEEGRGAKVGKAIRQLNWKIEDIYLNLGEGGETSSDLHELFKGYFNGQTRALLAPHIPTQGLRYTSEQTASDSVYEGKLKAILQKHYSVGVQECYKESVEHFAHKFGWKEVKYLEENITPSRPKVSEMPEDVVELIRGYNYLDVKLQSAYLKQYVCTDVKQA